jgi:hypothetical protein
VSDFPQSRQRSYRQLARQYFRGVTSSVLDPYLTAQGFRRTRSGPDELRYRRGGCLLSFAYAPYATDERPRYALTVAIGSPRGWLRKPRLIGLWQVPSPDRGGNRWHWDFRGPGQLERELKKLVPLLYEYARPLWEDETRLRAVLDNEWPIYLELANP